MRKRNTIVLAITLAGQLFAGGFFLQLGNPEANAEARAANAILVVKAAGCIQPGTASLTATAIGLVDGQQHRIPLKLTKLSEPDTFALTQQWPKEGRWLIDLVAQSGPRFTNTLVAAGPEGIDRLHARASMHQFESTDITAMLR
jgi:hypothetical protein